MRKIHHKSDCTPGDMSPPDDDGISDCANCGLWETSNHHHPNRSERPMTDNKSTQSTRVNSKTPLYTLAQFSNEYGEDFEVLVDDPEQPSVLLIAGDETDWEPLDYNGGNCLVPLGTKVFMLSQYEVDELKGALQAARDQIILNKRHTRATRVDTSAQE